MCDDEAAMLELAERSAPTFKALGDPTRLKLLITMHYRGPGNATVAELAQAVGVREATASAALNTLAASGIVAATRDGRAMRYSLVDDCAHRLLHSLGAQHAEHH